MKKDFECVIVISIFLKQTSEKNGYRVIYYVSEIITKDTLKK